MSCNKEFQGYLQGSPFLVVAHGYWDFDWCDRRREKMF